MQTPGPRFVRTSPSLPRSPSSRSSREAKLQTKNADSVFGLRPLAALQLFVAARLIRNPFATRLVLFAIGLVALLAAKRRPFWHPFRTRVSVRTSLRFS